MDIINLLEPKHISELKLVTQELYSFNPPTQDMIREESVSYKLNGPPIVGTAIGATVGKVLPTLMGSIFGTMTSKKNQANAEQVEKNIEEFKAEREKQYNVDRFIDNSLTKVVSTDAFNILSGAVSSNVEAKIGKTSWSKLEDKSRLFITTAEVLREFLQVFNDNLDYSPPTLNYCKAVENELNEKLLLPFKQYFQSKNFKIRNSDFESKLAFVISNDMKLTLGEHVYILRKILSNKTLTKIELEYKKFLMIANLSSVGKLNQKKI